MLQEMTSAKITRCNHYFHGVCLRKWLYVQDRCPFCHEIIMNQDTTTNGNSSPAQDDEANDDRDENTLNQNGAEVLADNVDQ